MISVPASRLLFGILTLTLCGLGFNGCACGPSADCVEDVGQPGDSIPLAHLQCWIRHGEPVLRDPVPADNYEVASDGHVFHDDTGTLRMIYTGDTDGFPSIKLATGTSWDVWSVEATLIAGIGPSGSDQFHETPFYRRSADGKHQIFSIGYADEETYRSQIFLAEADALEGPYTSTALPVVARGVQDGREVYLMTSPSVVEHEGVLHLVYLAWNNSPELVSEVWVMGATSVDEGRTWDDFHAVDVPIGMEGQLTRGPNGQFYATAATVVDGVEGVFLSRAETPFGPYETLASPILVKQGGQYEVHEANAPQITFDEDTRTAYLYYVGADYAEGWWILLATTQY